MHETSLIINGKYLSVRSEGLEEELTKWLNSFNELLTGKELKTLTLIKLALLMDDFVSPNLHPYKDMNGTVCMYLGVYLAHVKYGEELKFERNNTVMVAKKIFQDNKVALSFFVFSMLKKGLLTSKRLDDLLNKYFKNNQIIVKNLHRFLSNLIPK